MEKITLFDKEMNYLEQGTVYHIVKKYGVDKRNLVKGLKKYTFDYINEKYSVDYIEIVLDKKYTLDYKSTLKERGVIISKIGNYYYSAQDIEVRDISEKDIPFMQGSEHNILIYTTIPTAKELKTNQIPHKKYTLDYIEEYEAYLAKYSTMSREEVYSESTYNYYLNPRIDDIRAKASFAAAHEIIHGKPLSWFPVREKDIQRILNSIS